MPKQPTKNCPRCGLAMERIYNRPMVGGKRMYNPIGYSCPSCRESMTVFDRGEQQRDEPRVIPFTDTKNKSRYQIAVNPVIYERLLRRRQSPRDTFGDVIKRLLDKDTHGYKS